MLYNSIPTQISGIYKINFPNGKIYIGRAINIKRRIAEHYTKADNTTCYKALHKYFSSFYEIDIDVLEQLEEYDHQKICELEKKWIKEYHSFEDKSVGYNESEGGDGADYGINNNASKITQSDLEDIIQLLKDNKTNIEIGEKYNLHPDTIGRINQGKTYFNEKLDYPIRKNDKESGTGVKNANAFSEEKYSKIVQLLKTTQLTRAEIAKEIGCDLTIISSINNGKHFYCKSINETYPLRQFGRKTKKLSEEDIIGIKKDLLNPELSLIKIGEKYNCSRDTVGDINNGKRYSKEGEKYPIRTFYPKRKS